MLASGRGSQRKFLLSGKINRRANKHIEFI